jgi:hypothetical protein
MGEGPEVETLSAKMEWLYAKSIGYPCFVPMNINDWVTGGA